MSEPAESKVIQHGDYLVDIETGEVLGMVGTERFCVHDRDSAEWVLRKLWDAEAEVAAIRARRKVLLDNLEAMEAEHQRRVEWLRWRFGPELEEWATDELEGKKVRSIKTPFGTLSFRRKPPRVVVTDEARAIASLEEAGYTDAVKVQRSVLVSMLPDGWVSLQRPDGFSVEAGSDGFSIKTGLL